MGALSWFRLAYVLVMAGVFGVIVADVARRESQHELRHLPAARADDDRESCNLLVQSSKNKSAKTLPPGGGITI